MRQGKHRVYPESNKDRIQGMDLMKDTILCRTAVTTGCTHGIAQQVGNEAGQELE